MRVPRPWPLSSAILLTLSGIFMTSCAPKPSGGKAAEWEAPTEADEIRNPVAVNEKSIAAGKVIYQQNCLACHGEIGKGNGPAANALVRPPSNLSAPAMRDDKDGALFWKITEGHRPMPTFNHLLTDDERWQVVDYIRTLTAPTGGSAAN